MALVNPRRSVRMTPSLNNVQAGVALLKGATFHTPPTSPSAEQPFQVPSLPRRCESSMDDVVDAHTRRMAMRLDELDRTLALLSVGPSSSTGQSFQDNGLPLNADLNNTGTSRQRPSQLSNIYANDLTAASGNNTTARSVGSRSSVNRVPCLKLEADCGSDTMSDTDSTSTGATSVTVGSPIKTSVALPAALPATAASAAIVSLPQSTSHRDLRPLGSAAQASSDWSIPLCAGPGLSVRAAHKVHEHIIRPLLAQPVYKDFCPLLQETSRQVRNKEITCLRDLEKSLILQAPARSKSAQQFLDFCLGAVVCLQATVELLPEQEQTRPHDRPYTGGYFVDLVDQIKSYAQQIQRTREAQADGDEVAEHSAQTTDEIKLFGGFDRNGRPSELVRVRPDGKAFSLATGLPVDIDELVNDTESFGKLKRPYEMDSADNTGDLRTMARRKKCDIDNPPPPQQCNHCDKQFNRPCDMAKHIKTHSRPWKCPEVLCKYHESGWPTEKELARHMNDRHSDSPARFKCEFPPCTYESKRDSNRKQHQEKAHGWVYNRTKQNGGKRAKSVAGSVASSKASKTKQTKTTPALPTPQTESYLTPGSEFLGVKTPEGQFDFNDYQHPVKQLAFDHGIFRDQVDFPSFPPGELAIDAYQSPDFTNSTAATPASLPGSTVLGTAFSPSAPLDSLMQTVDPHQDFMLFDDDDDIYNAHFLIPDVQMQPEGPIFTSNRLLSNNSAKAFIPELNSESKMQWTPDFDAPGFEYVQLADVQYKNSLGVDSTFFTPKSMIEENFNVGYAGYGGRIKQGYADLADVDKSINECVATTFPVVNNLALYAPAPEDFFSSFYATPEGDTFNIGHNGVAMDMGNEIEMQQDDASQSAAYDTEPRAYDASFYPD